MTPGRKAEIEMMLRGITPFPWKVSHNYGEKTIDAANGSILIEEDGYDSGVLLREEDWDFIAAAPELVRELLAAVKGEK
jgi:hypothetical protein